MLADFINIFFNSVFPILWLGMGITLLVVLIKDFIFNLNIKKQSESLDKLPQHNTIILIIASSLKCEKEYGLSSKNIIEKYAAAAVEKAFSYNATANFDKVLLWTSTAAKLTSAHATISMIEDLNGDYNADELFEKYKIKI
jgi:hypothetical protein